MIEGYYSTLDILIAEKVFGYRWTAYEPANSVIVLEEPKGEDIDWERQKYGQLNPGLYYFGLAYSANDESALEVFRWLTDRGIVTLSNGDGDSYDCTFVPTSFKELYRMASFSSDKSFAEAICMTALACLKYP